MFLPRLGFAAPREQWERPHPASNGAYGDLDAADVLDDVDVFVESLGQLEWGSKYG